MKTTKTKAIEIYDSFHGVIRCLNGGTAEENERSAQRCFERLTEIAAEAAEAAKNPSKRLADDDFYLEAIEGLPERAATFGARYGLIEDKIEEPPDMLDTLKDCAVILQSVEDQLGGRSCALSIVLEKTRKAIAGAK